MHRRTLLRALFVAPFAGLLKAKSHRRTIRFVIDGRKVAEAAALRWATIDELYEHRNSDFIQKLNGPYRGE